MADKGNKKRKDSPMRGCPRKSVQVRSLFGRRETRKNLLGGSRLRPGRGRPAVCCQHTGIPVHIQFAFPAHGRSSTQSTTIGSTHRAAGRLHGFGGVFISEPDACSLGFLLRIIRSAVRLLQSTRSRAGSVDGLLMCGVRPLLRAAQQGPCRLALPSFW